MAPILQTDVALDEKEDDEDKMEAEDRGQGREEGLQYYRTHAELPFGSLLSYTCSRVHLYHYQASYFPPVKSNLFMLFVHIAAALPIVYFHHQILNKFSSIWILLSTAMP